MKRWRIGFFVCLLLGLSILPFSINAQELSSPASDIFIDNPDLPTLLRLYYFYSHSYNDRAGVTSLSWLAEATLLDPLAKLANLKNTVAFYKLYNSLQGFLGTVVDAAKLAISGNMEDAAVLVAMNMPDEHIPVPFASLFTGITKTEYYRWQAKRLYTETLAKLKKEDPEFCVVKETYQGKENCYKSWLEYRNAFQPEESLLFPGKLPRTVEETDKAHALWDEKTKFGEFSDGTTYTVSQILGEDWKNAFEDVTWPKRPPEPTATPTVSKKPTATPALNVSQARIVDRKKVYLGDKLLIDVSEYSPPCSVIGQILYAPDKAHFLVILGCFEDDNEIFLFHADGSDKKRITGRLDVLNVDRVKWEADSKSFIYHRINSFAYDQKTMDRLGIKNAPPTGTVRYTIETGEKTLLSPDWIEETGKTMTVADFLKLSGAVDKNLLGNCYGDTAPPIVMQLQITNYVAFELDRWHHYEGKDDTGTTPVYLFNFNEQKQDFVDPSSKFQIGKTYMLKGCRQYIGTGGPQIGGNEETAFGVNEAQTGSIVEK